MRITKKYLEDLERCYCVSCMDIDGEPYAFFATEGHGGCFAYDCKTLSKRVSVWTEPGGTMSMVPVPKTANQFLAGQKFFKLFEWDEAEMVWGRKEGEAYKTKTVFASPYLHRFDILESEGKSYFIGCTLSAKKDTREDWSNPGCIFVSALPKDENSEFEIKILKDGLYKNHGYERAKWNGNECGIIGCESGVYAVIPPCDGKDWEIEQIMTQPTSDIAIIDIDGDGIDEIATIEPFHGQFFRVYKKIDGEYKMIFQHPEVTEFYHVATSGKIGSTPVFVGGCRRGKQQLFLLKWNQQQQKIEIVTVEENVGPSNAVIANVCGKNLLISANREVGQAVVYEIEE